jgi:hypothetical protein
MPAKFYSSKTMCGNFRKFKYGCGTVLFLSGVGARIDAGKYAANVITLKRIRQWLDVVF